MMRPDDGAYLAELRDTTAAVLARTIYDDCTGTFGTAHHVFGLDEVRELAARLRWR